jgi:NB-ARC domain
MSTQEVVSRNNVINNVDRDQYVNNFYVPAEGSGSSIQAPIPLSFNDAPLDLLSIHFTGREKELADIGRVLKAAHDDVPARCVIHGMHGLGKTQLALQFAKVSFIQNRYSMIFWISATTVEKVNYGFTKVLNLVGHPDRMHPEQGARLIAARRWLENAVSINWLLVLDNADRDTLSFIREHLPRTNRRGNILFTTRAEAVAAALACSAGQQHEIIELGLPNAQDAANLLLKEGNVDGVAWTPSTIRKAEEVVQCVGRLPFAVSQAAAFMKQSQKDLDEVLLLFHGEHKTQVRSHDATFL